MELVPASRFNKTIADEPNISMRNTEASRANLFEKKGVKTAVAFSNPVKPGR